MDISSAMLARSDQLNSIDLSAGPQTVTILEVKKGTNDQPVNIITDVFGPSRPFKPSKTVLRILANAWESSETDTWVGRQMTLYREASVRWAGEEIGGIRISALSGITKPFKINLPTSKGKYAMSTVQPLPQPSAARDWLAEMASAGTDTAALFALGTAAKSAAASEQIRDAIRNAWNKSKETE